MLKEMVHKLRTLPRFSLATSFKRVGALGFWLQLVVGALPIVIMAYTFTFAPAVGGPRAGLPIVEYFSLAALLLLIFTIFWFTRYSALGRQMDDPATRPTEAKVVSTVWIGLVASGIGALLTMLVIVVESAHLLFYFLSTPQGGVPAVMIGDQASFVSAVDMLSLMALSMTLLAELIVIFLSLYLLFRVTEGSPEYGGVAVTDAA